MQQNESLVNGCLPGVRPLVSAFAHGTCVYLSVYSLCVCVLSAIVRRLIGG